ncbi:hypothetical protein HIM_05634 [Hirsutella minnesotensis 3608]|uniref:Tc1-like transposase DDE domain-containing protein n=1 Tax=Hirsutella minnesotensis 3608 TaxID=1043627 RepID=A0A0F7ZUI1_9HYPO|nr:hypothetical protein HIM_05634 [Hirsutella minnesotensis 3608]
MQSENRHFGTLISGNRQRNAEIKPEVRAAIIAAVNAGTKPAEVARQFGLPDSTVRSLIKRFNSTGTLSSKPRSGRPQSLSPREKRSLVRFVRRDFQVKRNQLGNTIPSTASPTTLRRALNKAGLRKWLSRKKVPLTDAHAKARLQFARYWEGNECELLDSIFSDESIIQNRSSNPGGWVWRHSWELYEPHLVNKKQDVKAKISIMVWGAISREKKSNLLVVHESTGERKPGFNATRYIRALEEGLLPIYDGMRHFQQDNARIHTARVVNSFFLEHAISVIDWPAYSPDLNPIEHIWSLLKRRFYEMFPWVFELQRNCTDFGVFKECLQKAWATITQEEIRAYIDSLPRRLAAVRTAKGWYTKY